MTAISKTITIIHATGNGGAGSWAGDPDTIDLDNFTFGTNYIDFNATKYSPDDNIDYKIKNYVRGRQAMFPVGKRGTRVQIAGFCTTYAQSQAIRNWTTRHSLRTDAMQYIIIRLGSGTYMTFLDQDKASKEYCKGVAELKVEFEAKKNGNLTFFPITGEFNSVWNNTT